MHPRTRARLVAIPFAVVGSFVAVLLAGSVSGPVGPFDATVSLRPSWTGDTVVRLGPLGALTLDTHDGPLRVDARVDELRPDDAEEIVRNPARLTGIEDDVAADARALLRDLVVRAALAALVGGAVAALVHRARAGVGLVGATVGVVVAVLAGAVASATWQPRALAEPRYTGLLAVAPRAVGTAEEVTQRFDQYRAQLARLVGNVATLYQAAQALPTFDPATARIRVLHVADLHLNPQAVDLIRQLVEQFHVDVVVDSGDTTDFGTPAESHYVTLLGALGVPYVWVRGNHDSQATQAAFEAQPNVVVLDGDRVHEVEGLLFFGVGDPRFTPDKSADVDREEERDQADRYAPVVARMLRDAIPPRPDVLVVHDPRIAARSGSLVPLVLAGHQHRPRQGRIGDALLLVQGTTGGAGLRGLEGEEPRPLTASVLYFDDDTRRLVAYDQVTVEGLGGSGARIDRRIIPPDDGADPSTTSSSTSTSSSSSSSSSTSTTIAP